MNVVSAVANLQKERDYYKAQFDEALNIIKQLDEGPGEVAYIHPWDVMELIGKAPAYRKIIAYSSKDGVEVERREDLQIEGKRYRQSPLIPARNKNIK